MSRTPPRKDELQTEKIQGRCVPELADSLEAARRVLIRAPYKMQHKGQKMGSAPFVNAVLAYVLSLEAAEQYGLVGEGMRLYEAMEDRAAAVRAGLADAIGSTGPGDDISEPATSKRRTPGR